MKRLLELKSEFLGIDKKLRPFILSVMLIAFLIALEYAITRPASTSFFISHFSAEKLPYAWLAAVPINLLIVSLYNRYLPKIGCNKMLMLFSGFVMVMSITSMLLIDKYPMVSFLHFVWKDIYILFMFKQLWSLIHSTINTAKSKLLYALMFGIGGVGSIIGSFLPGFFAVQLGSNHLFLYSLPIYLLLISAYVFAFKESSSKVGEVNSALQKEEKKGAFKQIFQERYITYILLLVIAMQMSVAFVEYQFNAYLARTISSLDLRTEYFGKITSLVNTINASFQFLGGIVLIHLLGLKRSHLLVPLVLSLGALSFLVYPVFGVITASFMCIKSMDHSFFGIIREMLYSPLKAREKFQAKAVIDVFAYRSAKSLASLILLALQLITWMDHLYIVSIFSLILFSFWSYIVLMMFREKKELSPKIASVE